MCVLSTIDAAASHCTVALVAVEFDITDITPPPHCWIFYFTTSPAVFLSSVISEGEVNNNHTVCSCLAPYLALSGAEHCWGLQSTPTIRVHSLDHIDSCRGNSIELLPQFVTH